MFADDIQSISIHPALGMARVGNSPDGWFLSSEVRGVAPQDKDDFRDELGRIKRQVPRFRLYATLKSGAVVELTADDADITWNVEVANLKAGWYQFEYPMDFSPAIVSLPARRNAEIQGADRAALDIRPSAKRISGRNEQGPQYYLDDGLFFDKPVYLGELRTDKEGRLLFFGGFGSSAPRVPGTKPRTFANNDGWHDDISDGVVRANVEVDGIAFEAEPAHVVVAPPNYAPGLFGVVTMDDVAQDLFINEGWLPPVTTTRFTEDVWPIFDRLTGHQWVNDGILLIAGQGTKLDARDPGVVERLADASADGEAFRKAVFHLFRRTDPPEARSAALPPLYGDTFGDGVSAHHEDLLLTELQYQHLERWMKGDFRDDWAGFPEAVTFTDLSPEEQVVELDRAPLYECLGGPFHPGIEVTWPFRLAIFWERPYRLKTLPLGEPVEQDFGPALRQSDALSATGPHGASGPGSLTRWLGVPWQTDEASCNSGMLYAPTLYLSTPSFWGARVPNQVLPNEAYEIAITDGLSVLSAQRHFSNRRLWLRDINQRGYLERIDAMVSRWWEIGMVVERTPPLESGLPQPSYVETGRSADAAAQDPTLELARRVVAIELERALETDQTREELPRIARYPRYGRGEV